MSDNYITIKEFPDRGDEECQARHPCSEFNVDQTINFLNELKSQYDTEYKELRIEYRWKGFGFGAEANWYELQGIPV